MARPRSRPSAVGVTQLPELALDLLEEARVTDLAAEFELEAVRVGPADLSGLTAASGRIEQARLEDVNLDDSKFRGLQLVDVSGERISAANGNWGGCLLRRVALEQARLTGLELGEAKLEEAHFKGCKLDYANFRFATIEHVSFEDCILDNADFQGARLYAVRFSGCQLTGTDFTKAELAHVDLRGSELALGGSLLGLRGAIVDSLQLMDLSRPLAHELGIVVEEA